MSPAISGPAPSVGLEFFLAQGRADRVSLDDRVGFCRVPGENGGSLTVWFRISNSTHDVEIRNEQSQQKLNCALFVKFL
jgi:hypothetical protein